MWFGSWDGESVAPVGGGSCGPGSCGVPGYVGPIPGDPSSNSILSAVAAFGGIDVSWTMPTTNPYAIAYTILYRGMSSNFAEAIKISEVGGSFYYDKLDTGFTYYYWIRFVSSNSGAVGDLIGPASATAKPTIEGMIELLTGQIDAGLLATTLKNQLDQISILNSNLLNEITDRETGQTTLAAAMADVDAGIAEAHTFILDEINTRTTQNAATAEQISGVVATLGSDIAATTVSLTASIDALTDDVYAMYVAKVTVNGLVGGFGIINDGASVQAGFDVDTFWIGRTSADKRKPFIIDSGVVYIDEGAINKLTFSKLRDEAGAFIVEGGKVKADYLTIGTASITNASITTLKLAGQAVTVPQAFFGSNLTNVTGTAVQMISATFDAQGGGFLGSLCFYAGSNNDSFGEVAISINGTLAVTQRFGYRVDGANINYLAPIVVPIAGAGYNSVTITATVKGILNPFDPGTVGQLDVVEGITLQMMSGKR